MKNHMEETKHAKVVQDVLSKKGFVALALLQGRKGTFQQPTRVFQGTKGICIDGLTQTNLRILM